MVGVLLGIVLGVTIVVLGIIAWVSVAPRIRAHRVLFEEIAEEEPIPSAESKSARVIDPANPPTWRVYWPKTGASTPVCSCHGIPLQPGDKVMLWPIPDHPDGAIDLFCERTFQEALDE